MADLIDKKTVEKSKRARLRDFYRNPKDCPMNPKTLNQTRDFYRVSGEGKIVEKERTVDGKVKDLPRAALAPLDVNREAAQYGPIFMQQYKNYPPNRRTEIVKALTDPRVLTSLLKREMAPTIKGIIAKRLKELGHESSGDTSQGSA